MLIKQFTYLVLVIGGVCAAVSGVLAQDADGKPHMPLAKAIGRVTPTGPVPSLAVLNAAGAKLESGKLTLVGVPANLIVFADRRNGKSGFAAAILRANPNGGREETA
jgi:hypothetical protein